MRNLKKILAMVLALVMSLSLMATAGAAQFPDVDDSNPYKTAIDVLDELKVFQGFEDGTFKPTDTLNRAQAAVLVYRIATGDVENKYLDNYTYMQQSKFNDLDGYNWAKGYINYCQNAGIVVGTSATTFNPGAPVTGYQLMVMLLRTLGYGKAGEFTDPKGWELQTAAIAEREGILKNVTGGDFGAPAPRQMVAEILFRGLLHDTVAYSALTPGGYTNSGETLGKKNLGLEDISGVVMANEFADLEDDDTLADGKTRLDVDGKVYNLDIKSELTDIGEIRHAYVQNGTKVLTTLENLNDSTVNQPENGKGTKVSDLSKVNSDTQYFLNFEPLESNTSEWRIEFNVEFVNNASLNITKEDAKADFEAAYGDVDYLKSVGGSAYKFTKSIKAGNEITPADLQIIKGIFDWADGEDINGADADINDGIKGSVYAGANSESSSNRNKNLAVEMTFKQFKAEYIDGTYTTISSSDNGEWLKTIDNNGDGVADYVFRTDFVMSVIADYNTKKETYFVEFDAASVGTDRKANDSIKKSDIVTEDELKVGDVILYTWIDGKCYVSHPEVDVKAIDKKGINYKAKTITCGDTTYDWSGIEQEAYHYYHDVSEANVEVNYNLYKDHFGYVRLFAEANKGFVLLTDGFYATDLKRDHTYKAEIWDNAAEELAEIDVANENFIDTVLDNDNGGDSKREEGTWDRLLAFEESYREHVDPTAVGGRAPRTYVTTIAAYDVNGDGVYALDAVGAYTGRYAYTQHELDVTSFEKGSLKDKDLKVTTGHTEDNADLNRVNATDETLYYYVQYEQSSKRQHPVVVDVDTWTGYNNSSVKLADGDRAYAVTLCYRNTDNDAWLNYETAEIIVIEHEVGSEKNTVLPVTLSQRLIGKNNKVGGNGFVWDSETGKWVLGDFEGKYIDQGAPVVGVRSLASGDNDFAPVDISDLLHFYEINENGELELIGGASRKEYADYNIYAGVIVTEIGTVSRSYGEIGLSEGSADDSAWTLEPKHDFYKSSDNFYTIGYDRDAATDKDEMLHVPGWQAATLYGDVSSTFSADSLDAIHMNRGDKVIYVTDGDGAVQSIINVTKSEIKVNGVKTFPGVYEGDRHDTENKYAETWTLMDLWEEIADEQGDNVTVPVEDLIAEATEKLDDGNIGSLTSTELTALKEKLTAALTDEDITVAQKNAIDALIAKITNEVIAAAELKEAVAAAPTKIADMVADAEKLAGNDAMKLSAINQAKAEALAALEALDMDTADAEDVQDILDTLDTALNAALATPEDNAGPVVSSDPQVTVAPAAGEDAGENDVDATIKKGTPVNGTQIKKQVQIKTALGTPAVASTDKRVSSVTVSEVPDEVRSAGGGAEEPGEPEEAAYTLYEMTITLTRAAALEAANGLTEDLVVNITFENGDAPGTETKEITAVAITVDTTATLTDGSATLPTATVAATVNGSVDAGAGLTATIAWEAKSGTSGTVTNGTVNAAGTYVGTITVSDPAQGYALADAVTYKVNDTSVSADSLTVEVVVSEGTNADKEITAIVFTATLDAITLTDGSATLPEVTATYTVDGSSDANAAEIEVTWTKEGASAAAAETVSEAGTYKATVTVTPAQGYKLADGVTYQLNSGSAGTQMPEISVTVNAATGN